MSQPRLLRGIRPGYLPQTQPRRRDAGSYVLILARRREPEVDVRTALLQALDLFTALQDAAGHA